MRSALPDAKIRGVQLAIVVDNKDGDGNPGYRVKLKFPWLSDADSTFWARIAVPMAGADRGTYVLPEIDDQVLVVFEHGDIHRPIVIGGLWSTKQEPVEVNQSGKNNTKLIKSRGGHRIIFDDKDGAEKITIVDKTHKNKIVLDSVNKLIKIESDGDLEVIAKANVIMHSNALKIGTSDGVTGKGRSLLSHSAKTFGLKATRGITIGGGNTAINVSTAAATSVSGSGAGELGGAAAEPPKDQSEEITSGSGGAGGGGGGSGAGARGKAGGGGAAPKPGGGGAAGTPSGGGAPGKAGGGGEPPSAPAATGNLTVRVVDASTKAIIAGAKVAIAGPASRNGVAGADGVATFSGIPTGHYRIDVRADHYAPSSGAVAADVAGQATAAVDVPLSPPALQITAVDNHFAPGVESLTVTYNITALSGAVVQLQVTSDSYPGVVFQRDLSAAEKADGNGKTLTWDGAANQGTLSPGSASPAFSPYKAVLSSGALRSERNFSIEVESITLTTGDTAGRYDMSTPTSDFEVVATVLIRRINGTGAVTPCPIKLAFSFTDPGAANATPALSFVPPSTIPLGKLTSPTATMWRAHGSFPAASGDAFRTAAKLDVATAAGATQGQGHIFFQPGAVGGDDYILKAAALGADGTTELAKRESAAVTVWRKIDFANVYTMSGQSYIDAATTHAEIAPAFETNAFVLYSRRPVNTLGAALTVKYIGLYKTGGGMKTWPADFSPTALETSPHQLEPTAAELADYANAGAGAAVVAARAAAKLAIEAKAQAWFNAIVADYNTCVSNWFSAVTIPAGNALLAVEYYHPKLSNAGDGATTFWPAGITINLANPGSGLVTNGDPDQATWREVQGFNRGTTSVVFKNYGTATRLQIVCRHEIGHGTKSAFPRKTFGVGDHSATDLMRFDGGASTFSNDDILKLRGYA